MTVADNINVFLELARRRDSLPDSPSLVNRIPLYVTDITLSISKMTPNLPIPFSGAVRGESTNVAFDMGLASKTISMSGLLLEQTISKSKTSASDKDNRKFTSFELAQLIHSYVDASFMQAQQNLNKLIILIPSRVGPKFLYHDFDESGQTVTPTVGASLAVEDCPLIPFNYAVRGSGGFDLDARLSAPISKFPKPIDYSKNVTKGLHGFIRSFDTTFTGGSPFIEFNMSFEIAFASM